MYKVVLFVLFGLVCLPASEACGRGSIKVEDNKYQQMLVAIADSVPENYNIVKRIKEVYTEASQLLFKATRNRVMFGEITILVPKSWNPRPEYEKVGNEKVDISDVLVDLPDKARQDPNRPFTIQTMPCGNPGEYTQLSTDYLLDQNLGLAYGPYSKVLVQEWAHLRYGVFDEHPDENNGQHFYAGSNGNIEATRCSSSLKGSRYDKNTGGQCKIENGLPDKNCRFSDDVVNDGKSYASLMYTQTLDHVSLFCDSDIYSPESLHSKDAPTEQNKHCNGRSVWDVLGDHPDFANDENSPLEDYEYKAPTFRVVRASIKRTVLVLDTSGSMKNGKIERQNQGCTNYISSTVEDGEKIGIVDFSTSGRQKAPMTIIDNASRGSLVSKLPTKATGGTSIGNGILKGIQVLNAGDGCNGAVMILISDGQNTHNPDINAVKNEVLACKMMVHTIAFTSKADKKMDGLARETGGLSFFYSDKDTSNALNEAFEAIGSFSADPTKKSYVLTSEAATISNSNEKVGSTMVDYSLGRDTEFTFNYDKSISVLITSPSGKSYDADKTNKCKTNNAMKTLRCQFDGISEVGKWTYNVKSLSNKQRLTVTTKSKPNLDNGLPIMARSSWGLKEIVPDAKTKTVMQKQALFAAVSKGYAPITNANVRAVVDTPGGDNVEIELKDNGAGADLKKDDGIYSAFFTQYEHGNGRYGVKVLVNGNVVSSKATQFQRITSGGVFSLQSYNKGVLPPGKITDLEVVGVDVKEARVSIQFTASGAQQEIGKATRYELLQANSFDGITSDSKILSQSDIVSGGNLNKPKEAQVLESFVIQASHPCPEPLTYYFAIRAIDSRKGGDAVSELSNIVSATFRPITEQVRVTEGQKVTLFCPMGSPTKDSTVAWAKDHLQCKCSYNNLKNPILGASYRNGRLLGRTYYDKNAEARGIDISSDVLSMVIPAVVPSDAGDYVCAHFMSSTDSACGGLSLIVDLAPTVPPKPSTVPPKPSTVPPKPSTVPPKPSTPSPSTRPPTDSPTGQPTAPTPDGCIQEVTTRGRVLVAAASTENTYMDCSRRCDQIADCLYWTWHNELAGSQFIHECDVMSSFADTAPRIYAITGEKNCDSGNSGVDCTGLPDGHVPDHGCVSYTACKNGKPYEVDCSPDVFNPATRACDKIENAEAPCGMKRNCQGKNNGRYADYECKAFYTCSEGKYVGHNPCPGGLVFNAALAVCDWPESVPPPCGTKKK